MAKVHVKTGDTVMVISGKDRGNSGKVLQVSPKEGKVIVEGRNMVTKHVKPRRHGRAGRHRQGRGRHVRQQGHAGLPEVRQGHACGPQDRKGRQKSSRLQKMRRRVLRKGVEKTWQD